MKTSNGQSECRREDRETLREREEIDNAESKLYNFEFSIPRLLEGGPVQSISHNVDCVTSPSDS